MTARTANGKSRILELLQLLRRAAAPGPRAASGCCARRIARLPVSAAASRSIWRLTQRWCGWCGWFLFVPVPVVPAIVAYRWPGW